MFATVICELLFYIKICITEKRGNLNSSEIFSLIDIVIFSADSEVFAFSAMFRPVTADFNFDISGHK